MNYKTAAEERAHQIYLKIHESKSALLSEFSKTIIRIANADKWDFAIPEMYLNYQDGFLFPICDEYRGMPLFRHPDHGVLYLRWDVDFFSLSEGEKEKYLCFDRHGNKYTVIIEDCAESSSGNPSYFRFLPSVRKYEPTPRAAKMRQIRKEV